LPEDFLSYDEDYEMTLRQPNLFEQQEKDELEVLENIESLNCSFKRHNSGISDDSDCLSRQSTNVSFEMLSMVLLKENFYAYDQTIKLMLIGNKGVGKTTFLNKVLTKLSGMTSDSDNLCNGVRPNLKPTMSLEIIKRLLKINNKIINLEVWDTNEQVLNSPIVKSKIPYLPFSLYENM
jgi:hypothetical protein